jgi:hypothetical protein
MNALSKRELWQATVRWVVLFALLHSWETYDGTHISGIQDRLESHVLPFFSKNLTFATRK